MPSTSLELARIAASAADDKKATDITLLDLGGLTDVCDYFLICTVSSNPQMDAVLEEVKGSMERNAGLKPFSSEGRGSANWVLLDYGSLVVHVFKPEPRDFYRLETLWGDAKHVSLDLEGASPLRSWKERVQ